jgi:hypothetical protein
MLQGDVIVQKQLAMLRSFSIRWSFFHILICLLCIRENEQQFLSEKDISIVWRETVSMVNSENMSSCFLSTAPDSQNHFCHPLSPEEV